ncbi:MAG: hypothetical protein F4139_13020 [Gemmatimonadetes bacterium]|nr:hypothetical protein [Gemmatimonadota bacterium]
MPDPTPRPEDDLAFIRRVIEGARETASDGSGHLILWGCLLATAQTLTYLVHQGHMTVSVTVIWAVTVAIGFVGSSLLGNRNLKRAPVNSLVNRILSSIWIGCALSLSLIGFLGLGSGSLPQQVAPGLQAVVIGTSFFASAVLPNHAIYWLLAAVWWILGGALLLRPSPESNLVIAGGLVLLMVVPGVVLRVRRGTSFQLHLVA